MKTLFKRPNESPGFLMWKLTTEWQKQQRKALAKLGLTHVQFVFLACLQWLSTQKAAAITQSQLAKIAKLDKMVVSETAQKLLKKKLIKRNQHKSDSRSYALELTEKGQQITDQALPIVETIDQYFFVNRKRYLKVLVQAVSKIKN